MGGGGGGVGGGGGGMRETGAYVEASGSGGDHEVGGRGPGMSRLGVGESRGEGGIEEGGVSLFHVPNGFTY